MLAAVNSAYDPSSGQLHDDGRAAGAGGEGSTASRFMLRDRRDYARVAVRPPAP